MNKFNVYIPLEKSSDDFLVGIASTISVDRDMERMSNEALRDMEREIKEKGVNLFGNHEHNWENTLGVIKQAKTEDNLLKIGINLDDATTNPKVSQLLTKLKRGIKLGLSIGGSVMKDHWEYDKEINQKVKVIDKVKLYEVSVVGIPSNMDSFLSLPMAIKKSVEKGLKDDLRRWINEGKSKSEIIGRLMDGYGLSKEEAENKYLDASMTSITGKNLNISSCPICYSKVTKNICEVCLYH